MIAATGCPCAKWVWALTWWAVVLGDKEQPQHALDMHVGACTLAVPCLGLPLFVIHPMHAWCGLCIMLMVCAVSGPGGWGLLGWQSSGTAAARLLEAHSGCECIAHSEQ
jgi:hypothetical protein